MELFDFPRSKSTSKQPVKKFSSSVHMFNVACKCFNRLATSSLWLRTYVEKVKPFQHGSYVICQCKLFENQDIDFQSICTLSNLLTPYRNRYSDDILQIYYNTEIKTFIVQFKYKLL